MTCIIYSLALHYHWSIILYFSVSSSPCITHPSLLFMDLVILSLRVCTCYFICLGYSPSREPPDLAQMLVISKIFPQQLWTYQRYLSWCPISILPMIFTIGTTRLTICFLNKLCFTKWLDSLFFIHSFTLCFLCLISTPALSQINQLSVDKLMR